MEKEWFKDTSKEAKDFVKKCCTFKVKSRPSASELLNHPWITQMAALR